MGKRTNTGDGCTCLKEVVRRLDNLNVNLQKVSLIEKMSRRLDTIENQQTEAAFAYKFVKAGFQGVQSVEQIEEASNSSPIDMYSHKLDDEELEYHHHKILRFLSTIYNFKTKTYGEAHQSKIARSARLCRTKAKDYLSTLVQKGYVMRRKYRNRVYYQLAPSCGKP